jgi:hypothetical protein
MWRFLVGNDLNADEIWGLTGFHPKFVGDKSNTNQIEHMTISAVAQCALGIPRFALNLLEEIEWMLRKGTRPASKADILVNNVIGREFLPLFRVDNPEPACRRLVEAFRND